MELTQDKKIVLLSLDNPTDNQIIGDSLLCLCGRLEDEIAEAKAKKVTDLRAETDKCNRIKALKDKITKGNPGLVKLTKVDIYDLKNSLNILHEKEDTPLETKDILEHYLVDLDPLIDQMQ